MYSFCILLELRKVHNTGDCKWVGKRNHKESKMDKETGPQNTKEKNQRILASGRRDHLWLICSQTTTYSIYGREASAIRKHDSCMHKVPVIFV